jgi:hypothetical protein
MLRSPLQGEPWSEVVQRRDGTRHRAIAAVARDDHGLRPENCVQTGRMQGSRPRPTNQDRDLDALPQPKTPRRIQISSRAGPSGCDPRVTPHKRRERDAGLPVDHILSPSHVNRLWPRGRRLRPRVAPLLAARVAPIYRTPCADFVTPAALQASRRGRLSGFHQGPARLES